MSARQLALTPVAHTELGLVAAELVSSAGSVASADVPRGDPD